MKIPEGHKFRKGDDVTVLATVRYDVESGEDDVHLTLVGSRHTTAVLDRKHILTLEGRIWEEGDRVRSTNDRGDCGVVVAFHKGEAWVELTCGAHSTFAALDLEVDPTPEEV